MWTRITPNTDTFYEVQISRGLQIWLHLLKKLLIENSIFCLVKLNHYHSQENILVNTQTASTCLKSTIETPEQCVKSVQN